MLKRESFLLICVSPCESGGLLFRFFEGVGNWLRDAALREYSIIWVFASSACWQQA